jgi:RNA polymerase sigma factor (sigma-70 family)
MPRRDSETGIGGKDGKFPETHWSAIVALKSPEMTERTMALEVLVQLYWKPVYKYLRIRWRKSNEDAKDLTQGFFANAIERNFLGNYDPSRARFRTYLRTCLEGFVGNEEKAAHTQKRGGDALFLSLDFHQAEAEMKQSEPTPEECFEKEWVRSLFSVALEELRRNCEQTGREKHLLLFEKYDVDRDRETKLSYGELAQEFGLTVTTVTNYLASIRREFRKLILQKLREVTGSAEEFRKEARRLFGAEI